MVEEPATDGDSDHTDSGETVDSKNTCELAVTNRNFYVCGFEVVGMALGTIGADPEMLHGWWL